MSSSVAVSVAATSSTFATEGSFGIRRDTGTPAEDALGRQRLDHLGAAGLGSSHGELVEEAVVQHLDARHRRERVGELRRPWRG